MDRPRDPLPTRVDSCPPLPTAYHDTLEAGLAALGVGLEPGARAAVEGHVRLLLAWNAAINLTAISDPATVAVRHVLDSLAAVPAMRARGLDRFVDLGSGGGFPGIPLAAALPADRALLLDSIGKKVRFLATVIEAVGLGGSVAAEAARSESLAHDRADRGRWPAVTARAVAPLGELVELALPLLAPGGALIAWKRGEAMDPAGLGGEIAVARRAMAAIDPGARLTVESPISQAPALADLIAHRLVIVERGPDRIDPYWPRDPATRKRDPW